jgi:hypothetical protein
MITLTLTPSLALSANSCAQVVNVDLAGGQQHPSRKELPVGDEEGVAGNQRFDRPLHLVEACQLVAESADQSMYFPEARVNLHAARSVRVAPVDHQRDAARRGCGHEILVVRTSLSGNEHRRRGRGLQHFRYDGEIEDPLHAQLDEIVFLRIDQLARAGDIDALGGAA